MLSLEQQEREKLEEIIKLIRASPVRRRADLITAVFQVATSEFATLVLENVETPSTANGTKPERKRRRTP